MRACLHWSAGTKEFWAYQQALALKPDLFDPQPGGAGASIQMNQKQNALMNFHLAKVFALQGNTDAAISYLFKAVSPGLRI